MNWIFFILSVVGLSPGACALAQGGTSGAGESAPAAAEVRGTIELVGLVVPEAEVLVRAQADGVVVDPGPGEGASVAAGAPLVNLDDSELVLEIARQRARAGAVRHHVASAAAELLLHEQKGEQLRAVAAKGASSGAEATQARHQAAAARAKLAALKEELEQEEVQCRILEARRHKYRSASPIAGEVVEARRVRQEYVRQGEVVAKVQSAERRVITHVPDSLLRRSPSLRFRFRTCDGRTVPLQWSGTRAGTDATGRRLVTLKPPVELDLAAGEAVQVEVSEP